MKHLKSFQLFESASSDILYYHGTDQSELGEKILQDGFLKPGLEKTSRRMQAPIAGRVYLTPAISHAIIYAIGGDMIGHKLGNRELSRGQYGYVTVTPGSMLGHCVPDEDYVGMALHYLINNSEKDMQYVSEYDKEFRKRLSEWPMEYKSRLVGFATRYLTDTQYGKVKRYDDYGHLAVAGKKLVSKMPQSMVDMCLSLHCPVANLGNTPFKEVWKFDKTLNEQLKKDGSNFFELAERVA